LWELSGTTQCWLNVNGLGPSLGEELALHMAWIYCGPNVGRKPSSIVSTGRVLG